MMRQVVFSYNFSNSFGLGGGGGGGSCGIGASGTIGNVSYDWTTLSVSSQAEINSLPIYDMHEILTTLPCLACGRRIKKEDFNKRYCPWCGCYLPEISYKEAKE